MTLDGRDRVFNMKLTACYPLQVVYKDIAARAVSDDPMASSIFDSFFKWLKGTPQYTKFVSIVTEQPVENREDMIKLFELMSFSGITADTFEAEVDRIYNTLPDSQKQGLSKYTAVLNNYKSEATKYTKIEKEIMRATNFRYRTPAEAWKAIGGGRPYPDTLDKVQVPEEQEKEESPHQYICNRLGLYSGNSFGVWCKVILGETDEVIDMETDYKRGVDLILERHPDFDMSELDFIEEEDKEAVIRDILGVKELDKEDPFRSWCLNPPRYIKEYLEANDPSLSYPELVKQIYKEKHS